VGTASVDSGVEASAPLEPVNRFERGYLTLICRCAPDNKSLKDIYLVRRIDFGYKTGFMTKEHDRWLNVGKRIRDLSLLRESIDRILQETPAAETLAPGRFKQPERTEMQPTSKSGIISACVDVTGSRDASNSLRSTSTFPRAPTTGVLAATLLLLSRSLKRVPRATKKRDSPTPQPEGSEGVAKGVASDRSPSPCASGSPTVPVPGARIGVVRGPRGLVV
jgi:hypothetical protein